MYLKNISIQNKDTSQYQLPFLLGDNFQSNIVKERGSEKKINVLGDLKNSCHRPLALFLVKKDIVKQIVALKAQFQMFILACFSFTTN